PEDQIIHPPIMFHAKLVPGGIRHFTAGVLYTQRGCPFKCPFCQTPNFDDSHYYVNFESIKRVLRYYRELGIKHIFVTDEILGINRDSAERLTRLLSRHGFYWYAQSRVNIFLRNLDEWYERGLRLPSVGLETMNQKALDIIGKRQNTEEIIEYARRTAEKGFMHRTAYSMIGYENMDYDETIQDAHELKKAGFDMHSVNVITPYPGTKLWDDLERKYGIFDENYRNYDARHLVWNHPHVSPPEMQRLLKTVSKLLNNPLTTYGRSFSYLVQEKNKDRFRDLWQTFVKSPIASMRIDEREQVFFPVDRKAGNAPGYVPKRTEPSFT
ncbi:MAG: B12-binding domain-containing radical SAM protein, partial [bacterium]|nr:B12-binding domain-containing radical SAM protein [bacterium]